MLSYLFRTSLLSAILFSGTRSFAKEQTTSPPSYVVVVSKSTYELPEWKAVVDVLEQKHHAQTLIVEEPQSESSAVLPLDPQKALPELQRLHPQYTCFVVRPEESTRKFVLKVHQITRRYDEDPWTDTRWGILTGFDAQNALEIASEEKPLVIQKVGSGTEIAMDRVNSGAWFCELKQGHMVEKIQGQEALAKQAPPDTTEIISSYLSHERPDLWIQSGHGTERDWMIGFSYKNGFLKSNGGQLYGEDTQKKHHPIQSSNPKVFLPIGNCLIGHIDDQEAIALAYMKSATVRQMVGYTVVTWFGYQGWGMLDYFVEQPGRFTLNEAFFANHLALLHRLHTAFPEESRYDQINQAGLPVEHPLPPQVSEEGKKMGVQSRDIRGLLYDRDVVAFYGDPAWKAIMADGKKNWEQSLKVTPSERSSRVEFELTITPLLGEESFKTVNSNGSQRGGRPIIHFLNERIRPETVNMIEGKDKGCVIADDFILLPLPSENSDQPLTLKFTAEYVP